MVRLIGRIYDFGERPLPDHLRAMGDELVLVSARCNATTVRNVSEIGILLKLLANTLDDANVTGDDDEEDD